MADKRKHDDQLVIRLSAELLRAIEDYRAKKRPIPSAAEVVREALRKLLGVNS